MAARIPPPPEGFDDEFFRWLEAMIEVTDIQFVALGDSVPAAELNVRAPGVPVPEDLRRFYDRYTPWGPLLNWHGWDRIKKQFGESVADIDHILPVDHRSYSSHGWDTVAAVNDLGQYEVLLRSRRSGEIQTYTSLRDYFIAGVADEARQCADG